MTLEVVEDPAESIQDLFIFTIENAASLRDNINVLQRENERLSSERANALKVSLAMWKQIIGDSPFPELLEKALSFLFVFLSINNRYEFAAH